VVEKLLNDVLVGQKSKQDPKKITVQLVKEIKDVVPVADEKELEIAIFDMVTKAMEDKKGKMKC